MWQSDTDGNENWAIGGGVPIGLAEGFDVFGAAVVGEGTSAYANNLAPIDFDESFWAGSAGILARLTEQTRIELGVGIEDYEEAGEALGIGGGIYWVPCPSLRSASGPPISTSTTLSSQMNRRMKTVCKYSLAFG